jgi:thiamine biosynthesis lipoprotein ApbE
MPAQRSITFGITMALCLGVLISRTVAQDDYTFHHENVMGTSLELTVRADDEETARRCESRVLREIDRLSAIFSGYDPRSEFSRWQRRREGAVRVSAELFEVLRACDSFCARSGRAFDPRVEALTRLWSRCALENRVPTAFELAAARDLMEPPAWRLDEASHSAERLSSCPLSLNGIAKGYIVESACEAALDPGRGVHGILLNVGGDLRVCGETARTVGIASPWADSESSPPFAFIAVKDRSVATSGGSQRGVWISGRWYSHVFDPRTGLPVEGVASATVVARRSMHADALAKVFSVLDPAQSVQLAAALGGVDCVIVKSNGTVVTSAGWKEYQLVSRAPEFTSGPGAGERTDEAKPGGPKAAAASGWPEGLELAVNFEINRPDATEGRYRRPYVAIWVEDKNGVSVRTLALWVSFGGAGPFQWLPDLKRWYKTDGDRKLTDKKEILFTVSRPTRPPGRYKVIWDGKDNFGKQLQGGDYTVTIEAAREHGTYQSIRKSVSLSDKPFNEELKGNVEIKSASIEYRRKAAPK